MVGWPQFLKSPPCLQKKWTLLEKFIFYCKSQLVLLRSPSYLFSWKPERNHQFYWFYIRLKTFQFSHKTIIEIIFICQHLIFFSLSLSYLPGQKNSSFCKYPWSFSCLISCLQSCGCFKTNLQVHQNLHPRLTVLVPCLSILIIISAKLQGTQSHCSFLHLWHVFTAYSKVISLYWNNK